MNQELKMLWIDALRSGDYKQGRAVLRSQNDEFCCLGVLCDLSGGEWSGTDQNAYSFKPASPDGLEQTSSVHYLPPQVRYDAELPNSFGGCGDIILLNGNSVALASLNDSGLSFSQIADLIENRL